MRRFIETSVPTDKYQEVKTVGDSYVCHFEPIEDKEVGVTTCYECLVKGEPDLEALKADLATWKAYIAERELKLAKKAKKREVEEYDASSEVNSFTYNGVKMWLDKAMRSGLLMRFTAEQAAGKTVTTLWYGTLSFELPLEQAFGLLYALEVYASACYDRTAAHMAAIDSLGSVAEVEAYDFRSGYPKQLHF